MPCICQSVLSDVPELFCLSCPFVTIINSHILNNHMGICHTSIESHVQYIECRNRVSQPWYRFFSNYDAKKAKTSANGWQRFFKKTIIFIGIRLLDLSKSLYVCMICNAFLSKRHQTGSLPVLYDRVHNLLDSGASVKNRIMWMYIKMYEIWSFHTYIVFLLIP